MPALTYDSSEVSKLVGIGPLLLNKLVERKMYGIGPSVRSGKGRGGRRLFSPDDVFGIALVWWLFESGLRSNVIQVVLDDICGTKGAAAIQAGKTLMGRRILTLRIVTKPRGMQQGGLQRGVMRVAPYRVHLITEERHRYKVLERQRGAEVSFGSGPIALEISVGILYSMLRDEMQTLSGLQEGE
jgi:hypothetical protein